MAYFNHAFTKMFLGTGTTRTAGSTGAPINALNPASTGGFITTTGVITATLSTLAPGYFGFFATNISTGILESVDSSGLAGCCPLILASSSLLTNDKIGPFHGGYKETNKSKLINPRYIQQVYKVTTCVPQQSVITIGNAGVSSGNGISTIVGGIGAPVLGTATFTPGTYFNIFLKGGGSLGADAAATVTVNGAGAVTAVTITSSGHGYTVGNVLTISQGTVIGTVTAGSLTLAGAGTATSVTVNVLVQPNPDNFQGGTTAADCIKDFLCGETYYLRIDVKGSPALRALNHNAYQTVSSIPDCCTGTVPTPVDSTKIMIQWASAIVINNYLKDFVLPVVSDELGNSWYAPGTTVDPVTGAAVTAAQWWTNYPPTAHIAGTTAGLRLFGAFVETKFGNCSFQITDFFEKEPVRIYGSLVDYNGDPCVFDNLCVYNDCLGVQGMGFGEQVVRDLILAESYLQNFFHTDIRVREITQGDQILGAVNRNALYTRYFLLHSVPRFNNPTGTFDNDRYMLEIIVPEVNPLVPVGNTALDTFLNAWLAACVNCTTLVSRDCARCTVNVNGVA